MGGKKMNKLELVSKGNQKMKKIFIHFLFIFIFLFSDRLLVSDWLKKNSDPIKDPSMQGPAARKQKKKCLDSSQSTRTQLVISAADPFRAHQSAICRNVFS